MYVQLSKAIPLGVIALINLGKFEVLELIVLTGRFQGNTVHYVYSPLGEPYIIPHNVD